MFKYGPRRSTQVTGEWMPVESLSFDFQCYTEFPPPPSPNILMQCMIEHKSDEVVVPALVSVDRSTAVLQWE